MQRCMRRPLDFAQRSRCSNWSWLVKIEVDMSEVQSLTREANASFRRQRSQFKRILDAHAADARRTHAYRNRTFNLERSTFASEIEGDAAEFSSEFGARVFYSSFVERRGYQNIDGHAREAEVEIDYMLDGEAEQLGNR